MKCCCYKRKKNQISWDRLLARQPTELPHSQQVTSYAKTTAVINQTMQFQVALIGELLKEKYNFGLTSGLKNDALETSVGLYRLSYHIKTINLILYSFAEMFARYQIT